MRQYCVMIEHFNTDSTREYTETYHMLKFMAVRKARRLVQKLKKTFRSDDRVFIKKGEDYINPDNTTTKHYGTSWTR